VTYTYTLRRARKEKRCRCWDCYEREKQGGERVVIKKRELYILYHGYGMGTCYLHDNRPYSIRCRIWREVAMEMLKLGVNKVKYGVRGLEPTRDAQPLTGRTREELMALLGDMKGEIK